MAIQQPWSIHEAVILLDEYLNVVSGKKARKQAIADVSTKLRTMATNQGLTIDEIFRNNNGITFQMSSIESAYRGYTVMKPATKLFSETVSLYKTDQAKYSDILKEAKAMCAARQVNEECYAAWLSSKVNPDTLSELYYQYTDIDKYMQRNKVISTPLLTITDVSIIKKVQRTIEQSKSFRISRKSKLYMCDLAVRYYLQFLESETISSAQESYEAVEIIAETKKSSIENENPKNLSNLPISSGPENTASNRVKLSAVERILHEALRQECENNTYGTTIAFLQSKVRHLNQSQLKSILMSADWAEFKFGTWHYVAPIPEQANATEVVPPSQLPQKMSIDFANLPELPFTTPLSVSYFGDETTNISTWSQAYLVVVAALYEDYSHILRSGMSFTVPELTISTAWIALLIIWIVRSMSS